MPPLELEYRQSNGAFWIFLAVEADGAQLQLDSVAE